MEFRKTSLRRQNFKKSFRKKVQKLVREIADFFRKIFLRKSRARKFRNFQKPKKQKPIALILSILIVGFGAILAIQISKNVYNFFRDFNFKNVLAVLGADLPRDENGFFNILLLGAGGAAHEGGNLTDTAIIASVDFKTKSVVMLSIPRDFYIETQIGGRRFNQIFRDATFYFLRQGFDDENSQKKAAELLFAEIKKFTGLQIHRFAKIDFAGFEKGVDAIGGLSVFVERDIFDLKYPNQNWGYELFSLPRGRHLLDGKTALKYARSRHDSSDFDRAGRQQKILQAVRDKVLNEKIYKSRSKLRELWQIVE